MCHLPEWPITSQSSTMTGDEPSPCGPLGDIPGPDSYSNPPPFFFINQSFTCGNKENRNSESSLLVTGRTNALLSPSNVRLPPSTLSQRSGESCHVSPRTPLTLLEALAIQRKWRGDSRDSFESCRDKLRNMTEVPREQEGMTKGS